MEIGMIGLGRMGANMAERLIRDGHGVVGYDPGEEARDRAEKTGVVTVEDAVRVPGALDPPRVIWIMVPAGDAVDETLDALLPVIGEGDVLVDGGNSFYRDTLRRGERVADAGAHYVDAGTSGGVWGLEEGYSLMVGGPYAAVDRLRPVLETLAPGPDKGWGHVGPTGAGHFVKMVHNGIEYGMMQAYAEGFAVLESKEVFDLDLAQVAEIWRYGSVIRSWLLDLTAAGLEDNPELEGVAPWVDDSGEGRWTVKEAIDLDIPAPVITLALQARLRSRVQDSFADRLLAVMRNQFGGHEVKEE
ncbi:MAG: phosphogluconate dehydrogenase (NAD(+)-dependent, decarboxylating) [Candidatus Longimicrobiales bacterium M2_2A_002]